MKKWKILVDCVLLCCLLSLVACRFDPFGFYGDSDETPATATIAGFTPEQIQQVVNDIKNDKAVLPVSLAVPAYSFYRFDYSNAAGGHRGSTILSYDQAIASPPYGIETTARVLIFEAMKARAGYSFDFFAFSGGLTKDSIGSVINAIAAKFADTEFLLNSNQNIGSTTTVMQAVNDLVGSLPLPAPADFVPVAIASPAVDLNLKPDFSDLPVTTITTLFLNEDLHAMYASMTVVGLANYSLFKSNVPAVSQPRPSFRLHKTETEHNITRDYLLSLAPIAATGSVVINPASSPAVIPGVASAQMTISQSGDSQKIVFTYSGDRGVSQTLNTESEKLVLAFTYRDLWNDHCESSKREEEGPIVYLNRAGPQKFAGESFNFITPITKLLCVVMANNQPIATFSAEQGVPVSADFSIPDGQIATLACYVIPPAAQGVEAQARAVLMTEFASETRPLDGMETASWNKARDASTSVELPDLGRSIFVPNLFKAWFRPEGTYAYNTSPDEFTPQVFRNIAAPASPSIVLNMGGYSEEPRYAFSMPIYAAPIVVGIATGSFNTAKTFSIQVIASRQYEYSLDNGATWNDYSGPVTLSTEGFFQVIARDKLNNFTSKPVPLTIDTTAPLAPTITGIKTGIYSAGQKFTIAGAEAGGTIYYSIDNGVTSLVYTDQVAINAEGTATCTAWQIDAAGNIGAKTAPVTVTIDATAPQAPTISGISAGSFKTSQTFTVTGSESGSTLYYSLDNGLTNATYTGPVTLSIEGTATCTAWQIDAAGNISARAAPITLTIDSTAPQAPAIAGIAPGIFKSGQTFTVTGSEPGGNLYYSLDNGLTNATYTGPVTLSIEGVTTCTAWQIDAAGNVGARATAITLTVDNTAPQAPVIAGIATGSFKTSQTFTVTSSESGGTLYYSLDNGLTKLTYTEPVTISVEGTATCTAWQIDAAGNVGARATAITVTVDKTAPLAPTITGITSGVFAPGQILTITGAEPGGVLYYSLDDGLTSSIYTAPVTISTEGIATCTAWQIDAAGNVGVRIPPIIVTIDNTAPHVPTITGITSGVFASSRTFTVTAAESGGTLYYSLDNGLTSSIYTGPVTISVEGTFSCTAWQVDTAGKTSRKVDTIAVTIDTAAPQAPTISGIANGNYSGNKTFTVTAAESGGTLYYSLDNGLTNSVYTGPVTISAEGTATCTAWQVDAAGNIGAKTAAVTLTIDKTAPLAPTISGISNGIHSVNQTFTVTAAESGGTLYYSLDNGLTNSVYTGPVTISADGTVTCIAWQIDAAGNTGAKTAAVTLTIDKTAPLAPTITGITSGVFTTSQTFTVTAAESGGTLHYSLDNGLTDSLYTGPVTISQNGPATCTAWQIDAVSNVGQKATPISLTILKTTLTALQPVKGFNSGALNNVQINGTGFISGIIPRLTRSGQTPVTASNVVVNSLTSLTCSFDLTNLVTGSWSVVLTYAGVEVATGTDLFKVQTKTWRKSLGGLADESEVYCVNAVEGNGVVIAGTTLSYLDQIPSTTPGTLAGSDIWIARIDDAGEILWSRRIGGSGSDRCSGLIALGSGYILAGDTTSTDGDMAFKQISGQRAMLMKISADGVPDAGNPGFCPTPANIPAGVSDARGGIRNTADGGGIMAGVCSDGSYKYAWAVKFSSAFNQTWEVRLTGNGPETLAYDVAQKSDGSYLLCGFTSFPYGTFGASAQTNEFFNDGFVAEISNTGAVVKTLRFGGSGTDSCTGVVPMTNGDFYVIGTTGSTDGFCPLPAGRGTEDVMVFKVTADFVTVSTPLRLGGSGVDTGLRGQLAADGGLLFSGRTNSTDGDASGNHGAAGDFWFGKVSPAMSLEWHKCFGGTADDHLSSFLTTTDGGYLLSGYGLSTDGDLTGTGHQTGNNDFIIIREAAPGSSVVSTP